MIEGITFPVYQIGTYDRIWEETKILYLELMGEVYKLDNKNIEGDTLGKRLLRVADKYKYKKIYFTIADLIKYSKNPLIDNKGKIFNYRKSQRVPLEYFEITNIKLVENEGYLLTVSKVNKKFLLSSSHYNFERYIGLLTIKNGLFIYELSHDKKCKTWRKI